MVQVLLKAKFVRILGAPLSSVRKSKLVKLFHRLCGPADPFLRFAVRCVRYPPLFDGVIRSGFACNLFFCFSVGNFGKCRPKSATATRTSLKFASKSFKQLEKLSKISISLLLDLRVEVVVLEHTSTQTCPAVTYLWQISHWILSVSARSTTLVLEDLLGVVAHRPVLIAAFRKQFFHQLLFFVHVGRLDERDLMVNSSRA